MQIQIYKLPNLFLDQLPRNILTGMLLSGDRISCCTHAAMATDGDKLLGICTIAPKGEQNSGKPTIVGLYVLPQYRCRAIGKRLFIIAIEFMLARQLIPIHIDAMSSNVNRLIKILPAQLACNLIVIEHHGILDCMQHM